MNLTLMTKFAIFCVASFLFLGCSSVKNIAVEKDVNRTLNQSPIFNNQFTGFSLFDMEEDKFIVGYNDTKRFTPASNTKILTMFTALNSFPDSIPGLLYREEGNMLWAQPVGNPTFLHKNFTAQPIYELLADADSINIIWPLNDIKPFGPGWAWEDYTYDFQPQRSWWPIYGNQTNVIKRDDSISVFPPFFEDYVEIFVDKKPGEMVRRNPKYNLFTIYTDNDTSDFKRTIPFDYSQELLGQLLSDTLDNTVYFTKSILINADTLYTHHIDSVIAPMMIESDNFLAEQLLLMSAWRNGYTSLSSFIKHVKLIWLNDSNDFVWVDGSGLSRYNLIAPVDVVRLYKRLCDQFGFERIRALLPTGGVNGTIEEWYGGEEPYIFAKTGTLSNNYNLSGFIKTRSNKWMIFSFMNNHFTVPKEDLKQEMQVLLEQIRDAY